MKDLNLGGPKLTIAIPTYNRLSCLTLLLNSVSAQFLKAPRLNNEVEVLVMDNASSDGTAEYLDKFAQIPNFRSKRQVRNLGSDANITDCFEEASGEYVWIIGDDDLPMLGSILLVLEFVSAEEVDLLYLPAQWEFCELTEFSSLSIQSCEVSSVSRLALVGKSLEYVTFISSWIVNRVNYYRYAGDNASHAGAHCGSTICQLEWIFTMIANGRRFACANVAGIIARGAASGGYSLFEVFSSNYTKIVREKFCDEEEIGEIFLNCMLIRFFPGIIWNSRFCVAGDFSDFRADPVLTMVGDSFGRGVYFRLIISPLCTANRATAWFVKKIASVYARYWRFMIR